jgi:Sec-independent protein translocase protein TatA
MKGLGKGVKSFKDGMNGLEDPQGSQPTDKPSNSAKEDSSRDNTNQES